ncbi:UDP-N-acetylmuramate--L-alanine ligase [Alkalithermobacter thermoalcaliphilus JW-YL-7 = DSM 7308]|uniref:UDP-N-acetylmuramate--L-alanine ligase n=1 Tax=Alkalithermobacter thermoalcaliphilus JW-YL-7 = DSM 7308 TaxID=1121328 RepID=A0A150FSQ1_CLOPD|nr:UDP-N-acetylmuramate--L-alanine ligase [[Clostridium] paradoxum JW-YL-7 = DSM 7308]SHK69048.1 UDP-N-acetylmuramate--L-alanine ligase [[Clostridium] paradoxum JW-YL-7 = DSM 7308]
MHIHFIGIGGVSMSALAQICISKGYTVSGSDCQESFSTDKLKRLGATIYIGHKKENISSDIDLVVYTAAIKDDNEELLSCKEKNIKILDRASFLGELMKDYKNVIAIAGTHGKTSTTSMTSILFTLSGKDPTILVGGNLREIDGNVRIGKSENFITEACEYVDSFLKFYPNIGVVLNIEEDHLDYFSGIEDIKRSFNEFGKLIPEDGYFIVNGDDKNTKDILKGVKANIIKYGTLNSNDVVIRDISFDSLGCGRFSLTFNGKDLGKFNLSVPGLHNIYNATSSIVCSLVSGIDIDIIRENISKYKGVERRFQKKGEVNSAIIIDDYAHHPTEVKATLAAAKNMCKGDLYCIFQPHTYTRTKALLNEFALSFNDATKVIITDIYAAREKDDKSIHSKDLVAKLKENDIDALYMSNFDDIKEYILENIKPYDLVLTVGAGNVYLIGEKILKDAK